MLEEIIEHKKREVEDKKRQLAWSEPQSVSGINRGAEFKAAIAGKPEIKLIAEIKRRSPSRGVIREFVDAGEIASSYQQAGAAAISVLTDEKFFGGSLTDLERVGAVSNLPILRKDFIIDRFQVWESAQRTPCHAILLIVAALADDQLGQLLQLAAGLGLAALTEVHDQDDLDRALQAGARIIGINNRDLRTFRVNLETTIRLRPQVPADRLAVSESGISTREQVIRLQEVGIDAVLVGETLMAHPHPGVKVKELLGLS